VALFATDCPGVQHAATIQMPPKTWSEFMAQQEFTFDKDLLKVCLLNIPKLSNDEEDFCM
jgi:hypothetical protein